MAEWLVEEGIGEHRALCLHRGEVVAARVDWNVGGNSDSGGGSTGSSSRALAFGQVENGVLIARARASKRGTMRFANGEEALVDRLPPDASEGSEIRCRILRPAIIEPQRRKLAQTRPTDEPIRAAPSLMEMLRQAGHDPKITPRFDEGLWEDVWAEAWDGEVDFSGGSLNFFVTPAMILIDVDGPGGTEALAMASVNPLAKAVARFDLGGNIGVDFPTLERRDTRKRLDNALDAALREMGAAIAPPHTNQQAQTAWPHERTAINGFGFVQIISRFSRGSLLHHIGPTGDQVAAAARRAIRLAEHCPGAGPILITAHPAVLAKIGDDWLCVLRRRTGREIRLEGQSTLALQGAFAQSLQSI